MVRPKIPDSEKKRVISFSLSADSVVILDNLLKDNQTRSNYIDNLLRDKGLKDLGLMALEKHLTPVQKWKGNACNPSNKLGICQHSHCQSVYKKEGLI